MTETDRIEFKVELNAENYTENLFCVNEQSKYYN